MRILLDHCTTRPVRRLLPGCEVKTTDEMGWADLDNGALLAAAGAVFDLFLSVDTNIRYQQNLGRRRLAMLLVPQDMDRLRDHGEKLTAEVHSMRLGEYRELEQAENHGR